MAKGYAIGEIAKIFNITTNKVRFYDKTGLLLPIREKDNEYRKFNKGFAEEILSIVKNKNANFNV